MIVGVPKEVKEDEYRVAITPAGVRELTAAGHTRLRREREPASARPSPTRTSWRPGPRSSTDPDDIWAAADLVLGVKEPIAEEYPRLGLRHRPGPLHLPPPGRLPAVHRGPAGRGQHGDRLRDRAPGRRLAAPAHPDERGGRADGPADGLPPPHATRWWPGRAGLRRARRAVRPRSSSSGPGWPAWPPPPWPWACTADVYILDRNLERLRQVDHHFRGALETVASSTHAIEETCLDADIVIGAVLVVGAQGAHTGLRRPGRPDASRARSWWTSRSTRAAASSRPVPPPTPIPPSRSTARSSTAWPTCRARCPTRSTHALVNATLPYVLEIANHGWRDAVRADPALAEGVNVVDGSVVYEPVAAAHGMAGRALGLLPQLNGAVPRAPAHRRSGPSSRQGSCPERSRPPGGERAARCRPAGPDRAPGRAAPCGAGPPRPRPQGHRRDRPRRRAVPC